MGYRLITNRQPRPLLSKSDLTPEQAQEFDYVDDSEQTRFVLYKGQVYDAFDTQRIETDTGHVHPMGWAMRVHPGEPLASFDSIATDSYFSGVAFRFIPRDDSVIVARIFS